MISEKLLRILQIKKDIKNAIQFHGINVSDVFDTYATNIRSITSTPQQNDFILQENTNGTYTLNMSQTKAAVINNQLQIYGNSTVENSILTL